MAQNRCCCGALDCDCEFPTELNCCPKELILYYSSIYTEIFNVDESVTCNTTVSQAFKLCDIINTGGQVSCNADTLEVAGLGYDQQDPICDYTFTLFFEADDSHAIILTPPDCWSVTGAGCPVFPCDLDLPSISSSIAYPNGSVTLARNPCYANQNGNPTFLNSRVSASVKWSFKCGSCDGCAVESDCGTCEDEYLGGIGVDSRCCPEHMSIDVSVATDSCGGEELDGVATYDSGTDPPQWSYTDGFSTIDITRGTCVSGEYEWIIDIDIDGCCEGTATINGSDRSCTPDLSVTESICSNDWDIVMSSVCPQDQ